MNSTIPDYEPISLRGSGAFGYVIEAYDRIHDARVAIKRTHKVGTKLSREYEILSELKDCEYVVKLMDTFYSVNDDGKVIQNLVFEYVNRSLESFMDEYRRKKKYIPLEKIKQISRQLLLGLDFWTLNQKMSYSLKMIKLKYVISEVLNASKKILLLLLILLVDIIELQN